MAGQLTVTMAAVRAAALNTALPPGQVVGVALATLLTRMFPARLPGAPAIHRIVGGAAVSAGVGLTAWAIRERSRHAVGAFELERPESLVTSGPYALSRHPMYVGWWLIHLGAGFFSGSAWVLVTAPAAILAEHPAVLAEERVLAKTFGADAERYAATVPRYFRLLRRLPDDGALPVGKTVEIAYRRQLVAWLVPLSPAASANNATSRAGLASGQPGTTMRWSARVSEPETPRPSARWRRQPAWPSLRRRPPGP